MRERLQILNAPVDNVAAAELLRGFDGMLVPLNADQLVTLQEDREFHHIVRAAEWVVIDSEILRRAMAWLGTPVREKVSGSDFFPAYCAAHAGDSGFRVFLLGGRDGAAEAVRRRYNERFGRDVVVGTACPPRGFDADPAECTRIVDAIRASGATALAVGIGAPRQEKWIAAHRVRLPGVRQYFCVGATIDFESGLVSRAPRWMQHAGLEWFHRLLREPGRLASRYLARDLRIFPLLWNQRRGAYRDPFAA